MLESIPQLFELHKQRECHDMSNTHTHALSRVLVFPCLQKKIRRISFDYMAQSAMYPLGRVKRYSTTLSMIIRSNLVSSSGLVSS